MKIDMKQIILMLCEDDSIRNKIASDFGIVNIETDAELFKDQIIFSLQQNPKSIYRHINNNELFQAAVKSLGSNSRTWASFIANEHNLRELLEDYNPNKVVDKINDNFIDQLRVFFPGQTCSNDVKATIDWAKKLSINEDYYDNFILKVVKEFKNAYATLINLELNETQLHIFISILFAKPESTWLGKEYNKNGSTTIPSTVFKFNGMGCILASEFLRNLGWDGFKPDRHIKRLFDHWFSKHDIVDDKLISFYCTLIGSKDKQIKDFIKYSLIGHRISPEDMKYSHVDNLIWALGAYVIKKGKENCFKDLYVPQEE